MNSSEIEAIIITGLSGSGKSTALNAFEDMGFYCIDNLPLFLIDELVDHACRQRLGNNRLALVMDSRDPSLLAAFTDTFATVARKSRLTIIFLHATEEVLIRRFSQHRRPHPLGRKSSLQQAISRERELMRPLQEEAGRVIDTSTLSPHELRWQLQKSYGHPQDGPKLKVNLQSFGFKHGLPAETDLLWDVRFLPNPYFVQELKPSTGRESAVAHYVLDNGTSRRFFELLDPLLAFLIPQYQQEGKAQLTISIGCTGGRHRSVAVTERLRGILAHQDISLLVNHRDIDKS